jgi:N-acetylneuraminic acid mutarotase
MGRRPNPRTGHSSVDYKEKMLIIIGGEGLKNNRDKVLFNDIWAFDIRSNNWIELMVENRASFRPRANFTANIYKNTIYIFGGFINLINYGCTD